MRPRTPLDEHEKDFPERERANHFVVDRVVRGKLFSDENAPGEKEFFPSLIGSLKTEYPKGSRG